MDQQQGTAQTSTTPTPPSVGTPPSAGQDSELYNQIAIGDAEPVVVKKKSKPFLVTFMATIMRFTLWVDSIKRTHELFFHGLSVAWAIFIGIVYLSGILIIIFDCYNRLQFPIYLEDQLQARNIQFESAEYSTDRIVVHHLKDPSGMYTVDTMIIDSTFADLLQKRIRLVTLDGLNIFIDMNTNVNVLQDIPQLLSQIQNPIRGRLDLKVDAITVNNAQLILKNQSIDLPISFSLQSIYGDQTQVVIPIKINHPFLNAEGTLAISEANRQPEWTLTLTQGDITLPRSAPENLTGTLKINLKNQALENVAADFTFKAGTIEKHITAQLKQRSDKDLSGQIVWEKTDTAEKDASSHLAFNIDKVNLSNIHEILITGPLSITSKQFTLTGLEWSGLSAKLNSDISCKDFFYCTINLKEPASVAIQELWLQYQKQGFQSTDAVQFSIEPQEKLLVIQEKDPQIQFSLPLKDLAIEGQDDATQQDFSLKASKVFFSGALSDEVSNTSAGQVSLDAQNLSYKTPAISFEKGTLKVGNLLQDGTNIQMMAQNVKLNNLPLFSNPFDLNLTTVGKQTSSRLAFKDTPISLGLEGQLSLTQKTFTGKIHIPAFDLKDLTTPLQTLWPSLPSTLKNLSGKVSALGQVSWLGTYNITGPLTVGLKDVSFDTATTSVKGINTVLTLETIQPFTTKQNQHLYIQEISGLIPFKNADILFQLDSQNLRLSKLSVLGAGIPLTLPASAIATRNSNTITYLKNEKPINAEQINATMKTAGFSVTSGTANVSVPLELQNGAWLVPSTTVKLQNTLLQRTSASHADIFGNSEKYFIRSGQVILDKDKILQVVLNGRLLPSKAQKDVQLNHIKMPDDVFIADPKTKIPGDIQKRLNVLFK